MDDRKVVVLLNDAVKLIETLLNPVEPATGWTYDDEVLARETLDRLKAACS
jgi:hypothetical protein